MFTIFGASGNTGSIVANKLLDNGEKVRVVARDPSKLAALAARGAEVLPGDVTDAKAVEAALDGARGVYFLLPPDNSNPDVLAKNRKVADIFAAAVAAVASKHPLHVVFLSSVAAHEPTGTGPIVGAHVAEQALLRAQKETQGKAISLTFIRAAYFIENVLGFAHPIKQDGVLPVFGGGAEYRFPMVATKDIGNVAADALLFPKNVPNAPNAQTDIIELSGPEEYSFDDAAHAASKIAKREVKTVTLPIDKIVPTLTSVGFSPNVAGLYREMIEALGKGLMKWDGKGRSVRGKVTLEEVLRAGLGG